MSEKLKVAIVVGHNADAQGATAPPPIGKSEFEFNNLVAAEMIRLSKAGGFFNPFKNRFEMESLQPEKGRHPGRRDWGSLRAGRCL